MEPGGFLLSLVLDFARESTNRPCVVVDASSRALVEAALAAPPAGEAGGLSRTTLLTLAEARDRLARGPVPAGEEWIVFSLSDEAGLRAGLEAALPRPSPGVAAGPVLISALRGLMAGHLARQKRPGRAPRRPAPIPDIPVYAIACTPRSGSTYLGHLLASIGLGLPEEHLRDREVKALRAAALSPRDTMEVLGEFMWRKQQNGWFGTKLISHFLFDAIDAARVPEEACAFLRERAKVVYVLRRDKAAQAASDFLANSVKTWHVFDEAGRKALEDAHGAVAYDYADMRRRYRFMCQQEDRLVAWVRGMDHLAVDYDDLVADPVGTVGAVAAFLGVTPSAPPTADIVSTRSEAALAVQARFAADHAAQFGHPPAPCRPEGLRWAARPRIATAAGGPPG